MNAVIRSLVAASATILVSISSSYAADLEVSGAWVRGTVAGQKATGAFMQLSSKSGVTIVGASSAVAGVTEIHESRMDGGMMKMRAVPRVEIPAGKTLSLAPGAHHVMLMDLRQPMQKGEVVTISLQVEGGDRKVETVEVKAEVRELAASMAHGHGQHKH